MQATIITGQRHAHHDPNECLCGCQWVEGYTGSLIQDSDTPKLARLGMLYAEFDTEYHGKVTVAYTYSELGLTAPQPEPERHESMQLFQPAPTQLPGQLGF